MYRRLDTKKPAGVAGICVSMFVYLGFGVCAAYNPLNSDILDP
jgi:hypothetical protein